MTQARTQSELWRAFEMQRQAINSSALAFDAGQVGEAVRLANSLFILSGRGMRRHTSILDQMGIQNELRYSTTVSKDNKSASPMYNALVLWNQTYGFTVELMHLGFGALMTGRSLVFQEWWDEVVLSDGQSRSLTRGQIIRGMRDQDGGAHYDEQLTDQNYIAATRGELTGFTYTDHTGQTFPVPFGLEMCMRQIAEEFRLTIRGIHEGNVILRPTIIQRMSTGPVNLQGPAGSNTHNSNVNIDTNIFE
jgi:hypothetical protein